MVDTKTITVTVNGEEYTNTVNVRKNLIDYLREDLGLTCLLYTSPSPRD